MPATRTRRAELSATDDGSTEWQRPASAPRRLPWQLRAAAFGIGWALLLKTGRAPGVCRERTRRAQRHHRTAPPTVAGQLIVMTAYLSTDTHTATRTDANAVAKLLVETFLHADLAGWLIPHLDTRAHISRPHFVLLTQHALPHGHIELTGDQMAVAVWYRIDGGPLPDSRATNGGWPTSPVPVLVHGPVEGGEPGMKPVLVVGVYGEQGQLVVRPVVRVAASAPPCSNTTTPPSTAPACPPYLEATGARNRRPLRATRLLAPTRLSHHPRRSRPVPEMAGPRRPRPYPSSRPNVGRSGCPCAGPAQPPPNTAAADPRRQGPNR